MPRLPTVGRQIYVRFMFGKTPLASSFCYGTRSSGISNSIRSWVII